jgi:hypothetical protein
MSRQVMLRGVLLSTVFILTGSLAADAQQGMQGAECKVEATTHRLPADVRRALVITRKDNPEVFDGSDKDPNHPFSLSKTLEAILKTGADVSGLSPAEAEEKKRLSSGRAEQAALLTTLIRTFRIRDRRNDERTFSELMTPRPGEAELDALELLDPASPNGMRPVGLFNRLDLAPAGKRYCGEHRIVYAKANRMPGTDRLFLIFEAALDNPDDNDPDAGCRRVAGFWNSLSMKQPPELRDALAKFYYQGDLSDNRPIIDPVIHSKHLGFPYGQVRGNLFVTKGQPGVNKWTLREWRTSISPDKIPIFVNDTVKANPFAALYSATRGNNEEQGFAELRPEFQENFVIDHVRELIELELTSHLGGKELRENDLLAKISARFDDRFNAFESISQNKLDEDPEQRAGPKLRDDITTDLKKFKLPHDGQQKQGPSQQLTAQHILNRAGALTCAGCHQFSVGKPISPAVTWPATAETELDKDGKPTGRIGFIHINEAGELSPALEKHFLPARCENLREQLGVAMASASPAVGAERAQAQARRVLEGASRRGAEGLAPVAQSRTRDILDAVQKLESRVQRVEALPRLELQVQAARNQDAQSAGAFIPFRRTH